MRRVARGFSVLLSTAGMEICRLYALGSIFFLIPGSFPFPFSESALSLMAATALTRIFLGTGRRRITEAFIHLLGFAGALYFVLRAYRGLPFFGLSGYSAWRDAFGLVRGASGWFSFWLLLFWTGVFWYRGMRIGRIAPTYSLTVGRFDGGIGILFFVAFLRMGIAPEEPLALPLITAYVLFGIAALFGARNLTKDGYFLKTRSSLSLLLPFAGGFLLIGGLLLSLYPLLTRTAGDVYSVLKEAARPLQPWLVGLLRFLFGFGFARPAQDPASAGVGGEAGIPTPEEPGFWAKLVERILAWGMLGILGILGGILLVWGFVKLLRYLLSRSEDTGERRSPRDLFAAILSFLRSLLRKAHCFFALPPRRRGAGSGEGVKSFRRLLAWGRFAGIKREPTETPGEYGRRLAKRFPMIRTEAELIVRWAERNFYGGASLDRETQGALRAARRRLGNPAFLPARLASRLGFGKF